MRCRFEGSVKQIAGGCALVEYEELMQEDASSEHLLEWFRLPGSEAVDPGALPAGAACCLGPGYLLRPQPPTQVPCPHRFAGSALHTSTKTG